MNTTTTSTIKKNRTPLIEFTFLCFRFSCTFNFDLNSCEWVQKRRQEKNDNNPYCPCVASGERERGRKRKWIKRWLWRNAHTVQIVFDFFSYFDIFVVCSLTRWKFTTVHSNNAADTLSVRVYTLSLLVYAWKRPRADMSVCQNLFSVRWSYYKTHTQKKKRSTSTKLYQCCWIFWPNATNALVKSYIRYCKHGRWWQRCWLRVWWSIIHGLWNKLKSINVMCPGRMNV